MICGACPDCGGDHFGSGDEDVSAMQRNERALNVALEFGWIDGAHHKAWVIDQMVRALTGNKYADFVADDWDEGIPP